MGRAPAAAAAKSLQSCPTLCDPIDGSPPGFPVPGILQARTLEWVSNPPWLLTFFYTFAYNIRPDTFSSNACINSFLLSLVLPLMTQWSSQVPLPLPNFQYAVNTLRPCQVPVK